MLMQFAETLRLPLVVKGGEASSQFRQFTKAKIEIKLKKKLKKKFVLFIKKKICLELRLQRYSTNTRRYSSKNCLKTQSLFSQPAFSEKGRVLPKLDRSCDAT